MKPTPAAGAGGLTWVNTFARSSGCKIVALSAEGAVLETPGGVRQSYRRRPAQPGRVLVWELE